jgi:hypothetical protein
MPFSISRKIRLSLPLGCDYCNFFRLSDNRNYCNNLGHCKIGRDNQGGDDEMRFAKTFAKTRETISLVSLFCHLFSALTGQ